MILTRRILGLTVQEYWFDTAAFLRSDADIALLRTNETVVLYDAEIPEKTIHLDLSRPIDDLFAALSPRTRHSITKSERDCVLSRIQSDEDRLRFFEAYESFAKRNRLLVPRREEEQGLDIFVARDFSGAILHAAAFIPFKTAGIYRYRYSLAFQKSQANAGLLWHALSHAKESGFAAFDLGGIPRSGLSGKKYAAILFFKSQFGGIPVDIHLYLRARKPFVKIALRCARPLLASERVFPRAMHAVNILARNPCS